MAEARERVVRAIRRLSSATDLDALAAAACRSARALTGADGATFVLRDRLECYYAGEDAIAPLWKGRRFPLSACIAGWVMLHRRAVAIADIYADPRITAGTYRPTFVVSLAMVPVRGADPLAAIGAYWGTRHRAGKAELATLATLADAAARGLASDRVQRTLERDLRQGRRSARTSAARSAQHDDPICPVCLEPILERDLVRGRRDDLMHEKCDLAGPPT
jgi:GAF domain-containing protein